MLTGECPEGAHGAKHGGQSMSMEHRAESEVVRPDPPHAIEIMRALVVHIKAAEMLADGIPQAYVLGLEGALTLAVDNPDAVRDILTVISNMRDSDARSTNDHNRAQAMQILADAARGILPGRPSKDPDDTGTWSIN